MSIFVVCPGCRARFQVSDQHAGKSGPCPKCKATIRVPTKKEEVKIEAPAQFGGAKTTTGELVFKPIPRKEFKLSVVPTVVASATTLLVLFIVWLGRAVISKSFGLRALGLLAISPFIVMFAYEFLRSDEELDPYRGRQLYLRAGICAIAYTILWGIFGWVVGKGMIGEMWTWFFILPPFLVAGGLIGLACMDLDFNGGFFLYCFYLVVTVFLRWLAGMGWVWKIAQTTGR